MYKKKVIKESLGVNLTIVAISVAVVTFTAFVGLVVVLCIRKRRTTTEEEDPARQDQNPIYGLYYFADGDKIDNEQIEVEDTNNDYGT